MAGVKLEPPPQIDDWNLNWRRWIYTLYVRVKPGPLPVQGYAKINLPSASLWGNGADLSALVFVNDEAGGKTLAFSDGTNWRRVTDNAIVT